MLLLVALAILVFLDVLMVLVLLVLVVDCCCSLVVRCLPLVVCSLIVGGVDLAVVGCRLLVAVVISHAGRAERMVTLSAVQTLNGLFTNPTATTTTPESMDQTTPHLTTN